MSTSTQTKNRSEHEKSRDQSQSLTMKPAEDMIEYFRGYAREKPEVAALWCFGIGFVLGWKLKPW